MTGNKYVIITNKDVFKPECWHNTKIGEIYYVTDELFDGLYSVIGKPNKRGLYPSIKPINAKDIIPSLKQRFLLFIKNR